MPNQDLASAAVNINMAASASMSQSDAASASNVVQLSTAGSAVVTDPGALRATVRRDIGPQPPPYVDCGPTYRARCPGPCYPFRLSPAPFCHPSVCRTSLSASP